MDWVKTRKKYQIFLFTAFCILVNYGGKELAVRLTLPLWLDAIGTTLAAYVMGPVFGGLVGVSVNFIYGFLNPVSFVYALTSLAIGICVGCFAKLHFFESFFRTLSLSVLVAAISTFISVILNILFYDGMTGNIWGDSTIKFLQERAIPSVLCYVIGEFYIDFLDKVITFLLLLLLLFLNKNKKKTFRCLSRSSILLVALICGFNFGGYNINAEENSNGNTDELKDNNKSYVETIYNSANGLPCGTANDIEQTSDGILWIGTYSGLYRYNGTEFELKNEYESVKNVNCLYTDEEGRLWIGTNDNGFSICINNQITNVVDSSDGLTSDSVRCIVQGADGNYYVGTTEYMHIIDLDGELKITDTIEEINYAVCITADEDNHVVAVNSEGVMYMIKNQTVVASQELQNSQEIFTSCSFDSDGTLYVGTSSNHIYTYDVSGDEFTKKNTYSCGDLQSLNEIYFTETGDIYICADNGVGYLDEGRQYNSISTGKFNNSIDNMTVDFQGNLWFVSSRQGLMRLSKSRVYNYYEELGLESKVVNTSEFWNELLYVGTDTGLDVLDLKNGKTVENKLTEELSGVRIRCIKADSQNRLWICTYGKGLWEIDGDVITTYDSENGKFGDWARVVLEMSDGTIAAAGDNGISFIEDGVVTHKFQYGEGLSNAMILSLMEMSDGGLMAGTDGDGIVIIKDGVVTQKITRDDGLSSGVILRTVADSAGDGIFAVASNGLCYISGNGTVSTLDNFPYFNNYDIWESKDGELFVLSSAGIYIVDRDELLSGKDVNYMLLDASKGMELTLTVNSWNACTDGEYLYLSADTGVYGIDMGYAETQTNSYKMNISNILLDNVSYEVESGTKFTIGRDVEKIEFLPEIINYTTDEPYVSYWLEGLETTPKIIQLSELGSIVYTNLSYGDYVLHLCVLDNSKETVIEETTCQIVKEKAFYDNAWFVWYLISVLALFVSWLTWFVVHTHMQGTLKFQKKELEYARNQVELGNQTILAIARTVDAKDERTSLHSQRVAEYSVMIARELGKSEEECEILKKTALLHDIGKIGIPDSVLNKPAKLTEEEYEIMKSHVTKGAEILKDFTVIDRVWEGALYHHERYDGRGYASGLKGEEIPLNARIIGIADAFDAMTANRVYRKRLDFDFVLEELKKGRGTQFDPQMVDIMLELIASKKINVEEIYSAKEPEKNPDVQEKAKK